MDTKKTIDTEHNTKNPSSPGPWQVIISVLASFFGVQSHKNHQRDFTHGNASHFIIAGIILTIVFVVVLWGIVQLVLALATS